MIEILIFYLFSIRHGGLNVEPEGQKGTQIWSNLKPNSANEKHRNMFWLKFWFKPDVVMKKKISKSGQDLSDLNSTSRWSWGKNFCQNRIIVKTRRIVNFCNKCDGAILWILPHFRFRERNCGCLELILKIMHIFLNVSKFVGKKTRFLAEN